MKNIHTLPTDRPSRLFYNAGGGLLFTSYENANGVNVYITSDEEISGLENNIWVIQGTRVFLWKNTMALVFNYKPRKIILTTDQDLIKDGVQPIDDEFLEWFIKNPGCETVGIENGWGLEIDIETPYYKIITPEEQTSEEVPNELEPVLAKIASQSDLGRQSWYEVVYWADGEWSSYDGSRTFQDGEKVLDWVACSEVF
jgi:hypothetical protein